MPLFRTVLFLSLLATSTNALESSQGDLTVTRMVDRLDEPWAVAFLPDGKYLVTERGGTLWIVDKGRKTKVRGVPNVADSGQGGLLDVMVPADFSSTREIYLTYAVNQGRRSGTALGRGQLNSKGTGLTGFEMIFEIEAGSNGGRHFGSRLVEAPDGTIYMTIGERGDRRSAQDLSNHNGSVLRLTRDGQPAPGNPFLSKSGIQPEIYSYGHRNPQGAALDLDGNILVNEHGAAGGDEINLIRKGRNYGWPIISYGRHYSGAKIGEGTSKSGMEQPELYWDPSIAPSGLMVYSGKLWPEWRGDIFSGSLKFGLISRVEQGRSMREVERLQSEETARVRDVREAPDGSIWFISVVNGAVYRITP